MAKTSHPAVLTANDLLNGDAVWWTGAEWSTELRRAAVAETQEARAELEIEAAQARHEAVVVGPYLVDVAVKSGAPFPLVRREAIRADREPTFAYGVDAAPERAAA